MNEFDFLTGTIPQDSISAQLELAKALKRKSNLGTLAQLSGDKVLAPLGQQFSKQADQYAEATERSRQMNADNAQTKTYQDAQMQQMEGVLAESIRAAKARDATDRRGQDLALQATQNRLNAKEPKIPRLAEGDKKRLDALSTEMSAFDSLENFYEKGGKMGAIEVAGIPIPGARALSNTLASRGLGTQGAKESFAAKQEFDRLYTLATRNRLFGATLSVNEKKAFDDANPSTRQTDDQIKAAMGAMKKIVKAKLRRTVGGLKAEGYADEAIKAYGFDPEVEEEEQSPPQTGGATATYEVAPKGGLTEAEKKEMVALKKSLGL